MIKRLQGRNRQFGIEAGSPNFAQGGTPNRFALDDELIRQSRGELFGEPMMEVLPTFAPYKWAFGDDGMEPEDAIAAGSGESLDRNLWGGTYYGYHPFRDHGYDPSFDQVSHASLGVSYLDPYGDPDQDLWHYGVPVEAQPKVQLLDPWHTAFARAFGKRTHPAREKAGEGLSRGYESLNFDGYSA